MPIDRIIAIPDNQINNFKKVRLLCNFHSILFGGFIIGAVLGAHYEKKFIFDTSFNCWVRYSH